VKAVPIPNIAAQMGAPPPPLPTHKAAQPPPGAGPPQGGPSPQQIEQLMMAVQGPTHGGHVPMTPGGDISAQYPGLKAAMNVDWQKVNPRLLQLLDKEAQKLGGVIVLQSGYRSADYNAQIGGHPNSPHRRGLAVDAFIAGHPLGEVVDPQKLIKMGLSTGGANGDPAHVELVGIPVKGGRGQSRSQQPSKTSTPSQPSSQALPLSLGASFPSA